MVSRRAFTEGFEALGTELITEGFRQFLGQLAVVVRQGGKWCVDQSSLTVRGGFRSVGLGNLVEGVGWSGRCGVASLSWCIKVAIVKGYLG
ncbi:hypothetical protein LR48_Vigan10g165900 [Vigna angularis]|uniref:Uncharacterized protein n=1 Tax=Phaseolus angularis TaxID=3914 RepID=A0A0L9VLI9_PHAAN|nr:hypothetical protein LR48_Vigan10g165900 [Vigna angularis]